MISWNECDTQFAKHGERIAQIERDGWMTFEPKQGRRRRGVKATTAAIFAIVPARTGAALIVLGRWLNPSERSVKVG
jgi:hypothetical protein